MSQRFKVSNAAPGGLTIRSKPKVSPDTWFKEYSKQFGWNRTFEVEDVQRVASDGQVAIICGQNKIPNRSGHIVAVVPETEMQKAVRSGGKVTRPLQSQAGRVNHKYMTQVWWTGATFSDFGFWINSD